MPKFQVGQTVSLPQSRLFRGIVDKVKILKNMPIYTVRFRQSKGKVIVVTGVHERDLVHE